MSRSDAVVASARPHLDLVAEPALPPGVRGVVRGPGSTPVRYEAIGPDGAPVVVVLGGISATSHVARSSAETGAGWWEGIVGAGGAIDVTTYRAVGVDYLAHAGVTTAEQGDAVVAVLRALGAAAAHAIVGASYGAMVALAVAERHPARVRRLVAISGAHRSDPMTTAIRAIQRRIIALGADAGRADDGVALARALAMTTYRTRREFAQRFDNAPVARGGTEFPAEQYVMARGRDYATGVSPSRLAALSLSLDLHSVRPERVTVPATLVAIEEDQLVPLDLVRELHERLAGPAELIAISSVYGHDAFLKETARLAPVIRSALAGVTTPTTPALEARRVAGRAPTAEGAAGAPARFTTRAVRAGIATDVAHGAVVPPLHLSSTFAFRGFNEPRTYDYTRSGNPTRSELGAALASLEGGAGAVVTSSGMSAVALVVQTLVAPGELVVAAHDCYGGTHRLLRSLAARGHCRLSFVDLNDPVALAAALAGSPRLVWIETPSNPLLRITDLRTVSDAAHAARSVVVADNTFLSPALQRPLEHGADIVVHSTTKYLNGHSDVVGGAVVARDPAVVTELAWWGNCLGLTGAPFDSYLTLRGVRTLGARMRVHEENARQIAASLAVNPAVCELYYPGLECHPGHAVARRQQSGFGAMISFALAGDTSTVRRFVVALRHFTLAESLGGVESLVAHPATMTHASMDAEARRVAGISETLLRLSVGIEDVEDLERDLQQAIAVAVSRQR